MNNQNNLGNNQSGYMSGYQQYHQPTQQFAQQYDYPQYIADQHQPHQVYPFSQAPPPPPEERPPEPSHFNSGPGKGNRGSFQNVNYRGQNKQNWPRGGHRRGGHRGGGFSGFQQTNVNYPNNMQQQNQGRHVQHVDEIQNFNQHRLSQTHVPPPTPAISIITTTPQKEAPTPTEKTLTQEEIEFDDQFRKWEDEFDKWKQANINHPDKVAYKNYEQQFESVRVQLLQRRNEMQKKKIKEQQLANPAKTAEQEKFESQWKAGTPQKADVPTPSTSQPLMPPPPTDPKEFTNDSYDDIKHFESLEAVGTSFNSTRIWPSRSGGIPCLDLAPEEPKQKPVNNVPIIDLDPDENFVEPQEPPPLVNFSSNTRQVIDIKDILEEPGRSERPQKILILIRGAPGSGKTFLANLILEKEKAMGNHRSKALRIENIDSKTDRAMLEKYQDDLMHQLRDLVRLSFLNFIIVEIEGGKMMYYNKYANVAQTIGNFKCYVIELHQSLEVCIKYNRNRRSRRDIEEAVDEMKKFSSPAKTTMLDPSWLLMNKRQNAYPSIEPNLTTAPVLNDLASNLAHLLQDKKVMSLLHSQLNNQSQNPPPNDSKSLPENTTTPQKNLNQQNYSNYNDSQTQQTGFGNAGLRRQFPPNLQSEKPPDNYNNFNQSQQTSFSDAGPRRQFPPSLQSTEPLDNYNNFNQSQQTSFSDTGPRRQFPPSLQLQEPLDNFNNFNQPQSIEPSYNDCPTFTPSKIVDYKHVHMPTLAEQLLEFKIFRVIDYKHQTTAQLREYVKDIDTDKIIEKRKSVALRKKILEYLRSAERPEDTVSNPKYPRNWEEIKRDRPPTTNKRKKMLTAKIKRVLAQKETEWMTVGYSRDKKMDLEEISSDDDCGADDFDSTPKSHSLPAQFQDLYGDLPQTMPSFNSSNHPNVIDIKSLLWRPDRVTRPSWILIILRGAPGSGKTFLTQLIKRKELEMISSGPRIISINDYFDEDDGKDSEDDPKIMETYLNQMVKFVEKTIKERRYEMIIVDAENVDLTFYHKFYQAGTSKGFTSYTIEIDQKLDICLEQNIHKRSATEISAAIEKLGRYPTPRDHTLLIPTALYQEYGCMVNPVLIKEPSPSSQKELLTASNLADRWEKFGEAIKNLLPVSKARSVINIKTILDEPWRSSREKKILIILRGASASGKSFLAGMIRSKEAAINFNGVVLLSIADYFIDPSTLAFKYDESKLKENIQKMLVTLENIINEGCNNFIMIDAKNEKIEDYQKFVDTGKLNGYKCYLIDFLSAFSVFEEIDFENQSSVQNEEKLESILSSVSKDVTLLNPLALYRKDSVTADVLPLKSALRTHETALSANFLQQDIQTKLPLKKDPPKIPEFNWHNRDDVIDAHDIFEDPGRATRPEKIVIILRGAPGAGKSFLADLIQQKETKNGNRSQFKIVSLGAYVDDNFQSSKINEYMENLIESLNEIMQSSKFNFIVVDADCCDLPFYNRIYEIAQHHNFTGYTIELNQDDAKCIQQCDHKRDEEIISRNKLMGLNPTPDEHPLLDPEYLYEENCFEADDEESMVFEVLESDEEVSATFGPIRKTTIESKWDDDGDDPDVLIERLDGTRNKTFEHLTMAAFLQTDDEWTMRPSTSGKKRVRWADIEEKKEQERMREIGFIVGQTDWKRMTDTTDGRSALEKTKYIEPRKK